jgi:2-polyprenyl-3-methyl-5-hydroxy-6-metoxy-1,4-benzoquinol methylase
MTGLKDVVAAWRQADPKHIHPTREHVSEQAYWDSGKPQAELILDLVPDKGKVLDFGCGDGRIAIPLAKLGFQVIAVDAAPEMIDRLKHQAKANKLHPKEVACFVSDGTKGLPDVRVGVVNARAVFIHHAHDDVAAMVKNLAEHLQPGGFMVADWPVGEHRERKDWIDVTTWSFEEREKIAAAAGLELVTEGVPTVRPSVWVKK